jgi:hypothetical protein
LDTIHLASCLPCHQTWCIYTSVRHPSSESVNHSLTLCLPMLKLGWQSNGRHILVPTGTMLSSSTNFLCTNFHGGATDLTMLSSHHWPGMAFSFLLMLLTPTGRELCSNCFQKRWCLSRRLWLGWGPRHGSWTRLQTAILNDDPELTQADESDSDSVQSDSVHCQAQRYEHIDRDSSCHSLLAWEQPGDWNWKPLHNFGLLHRDEECKRWHFVLCSSELP